MNLQVIAQLFAAAAIILSGPAVIILIALNKGNL
jgi:hypothetical protein